MTVQNLHQPVLGSELEFLDSFLFQFLFSSKIEFIAEGFELVLELLVLFIERPEFIIVVQMLPCV